MQVGLQGALVREEHRGGGLTEGCAAVRVSAASAGVEALARGGGGEQEAGLLTRAARSRSSLENSTVPAALLRTVGGTSGTHPPAGAQLAHTMAAELLETMGLSEGGARSAACPPTRPGASDAILKLQLEGEGAPGQRRPRWCTRCGWRRRRCARRCGARRRRRRRPAATPRQRRCARELAELRASEAAARAQATAKDEELAAAKEELQQVEDELQQKEEEVTELTSALEAEGRRRARLAEGGGGDGRGGRPQPHPDDRARGGGAGAAAAEQGPALRDQDEGGEVRQRARARPRAAHPARRRQGGAPAARGGVRIPRDRSNTGGSARARLSPPRPLTPRLPRPLQVPRDARRRAHYRERLDNSTSRWWRREARNREAKKGLREKTREINRLHDEVGRLGAELQSREDDAEELIRKTDEAIAELDGEKRAAEERAARSAAPPARPPARRSSHHLRPHG